MDRYRSQSRVRFASPSPTSRSTRSSRNPKQLIKSSARLLAGIGIATLLARKIFPRGDDDEDEARQGRRHRYSFHGGGGSGYRESDLAYGEYYPERRRGRSRRRSRGRSRSRDELSERRRLREEARGRSRLDDKGYLERGYSYGGGKGYTDGVYIIDERTPSRPRSRIRRQSYHI